MKLSQVLVPALLLAACGHAEPIPAASVDAGPFVTAPHDPPPQLVNPGGPVMANPVLLAVTFPGDPLAAEFEAFVAALPGSSYWQGLQQYGVEGATAAQPLRSDQVLNSQIGDLTLDNLRLALDAGPDTLPIFFTPPGVSVVMGGEPSCASDGGKGYAAFHTTTLPPGITLPYAVVPRCDTGPTALDALTSAASHEIVEAVTDPEPLTDAGWRLSDADFSWVVASKGGEVADLCQQVYAASVKPGDLPYVVQRYWSNAAALADQDPCVPSSGGPVAGAWVPDLEPITVADGAAPVQTRGLFIGVGQSKTVEVHLYSNVPTPAWCVIPLDFDAVPSLRLVLDKPCGQNGDVLHLTITVNRGGNLVGAFTEGFRLGAFGGPDSTIEWPVLVQSR